MGCPGGCWRGDDGGLVRDLHNAHSCGPNPHLDRETSRFSRRPHFRLLDRSLVGVCPFDATRRLEIVRAARVTLAFLLYQPTIGSSGSEAFLFLFAVFVMGVLYEVTGVAYGQTIGKTVAGIRVIDARGGLQDGGGRS